jgi:hypothetical protein
VRLSDLISFIRLSSAQFEETQLGDEERLTLLKAGFPRRDLISWMDSTARDRIPPARYFPLLLLRVAAQINVRYNLRYEVVCAHATDLDLVDALPRAGGSALVRWEMNEAGLIRDPIIPLQHEVGVVSGLFMDPRDIDSFRYCCAVDFYHANRVLLMSGVFYDAWGAAGFDVPLERQVFRGVLQDWGGERTCLLYTSARPFRRRGR